MKSNKKIIAIIIPVFNGLEYTKQCLSTLFSLISRSEVKEHIFKIIVVDDGSTDGTSPWIKENCPSVHLLNGNGDLWWTGGINMGIKYAIKELNTEYVLWWNNDITPANDYLNQIERLIKKYGKNVIIGSKVFTLKENLLWGMGGKFDPFTGRRCMYGELQKDSDIYRTPIETDWLPGMGTLLHRKVFEKTGMPDEKNFPQYHGDSDFTYRAKKGGFKLIVSPELVIYNDNTNTGIKHKGRFSDLYKSLTSIKSNYNIKKDFLFYKKHACSTRAYMFLLNRYFRYIGGFYKWKFLNAMGVKKN